MKQKIVLSTILSVIAVLSVLAQGTPTRLEIDMGNFGLGKRATLQGEGITAIEQAGADHRVVFSIGLEAPAYLQLGISTSTNRIYMEPGKTLRISVLPEDEVKRTYNLMRLNLRFEGETAGICRYLNEVTLDLLPDSIFLKDQSSYIAEMENLIEVMNKKIDSYNLDQNFKTREKLNFRYRSLEKLTRYPVQHYWKGGNQLGLIYDHGEDMSTIHDYVRMQLVDDATLWKEDSYRKFVNSAIGMLGGIFGHIDWVKMFRSRIGVATSRFSTPAILEDYVQGLALNYITSTESNSLGELQADYDLYVKRADYREELKKAMKQWDSFAKGTAFSTGDDAYTDVKGNKFDMATLKGKYVYIDVWATWCAPCRAEIPHLKELEKKYHGRNITFVSISIDQRRKDWVDMVERDKMTGIQLHGGPNAPIVRDYKISGIPRFFLLDRDGNIINTDMSRPSDANTVKVFDELPGL